MLNCYRARIGGHKINNKEFKVWISLIRNLGYKRYQRLIQGFDSKKALWNASKEQLLKIEGIGKNLSEIISNNEIKNDVKRHIQYMNNHSFVELIISSSGKKSKQKLIPRYYYRGQPVSID